MKKFLSVFLAALMLLSLCACGTQKAEKTMRTFCDGMKEYDFEKMQACLVPSAGSIQAKIGEMEGGEEAAALLYAKMKEWAAKMTYEIVSVNEEGDYVTEEFVDYVHPLIQGHYNPMMVAGLPRHLTMHQKSYKDSKKMISIQ